MKNKPLSQKIKYGKVKPFTYHVFRTIYSKVPRMCVEILIRTNEGIMLTLRNKYGYENQWHIPGGTVLYKESLKTSAKRIAKEELGIKIEIKKMLGYIEYFSEESERGFGYSIGFVFSCKLLSTNQITLNKQASEVRFFQTLPKNIVKEQGIFLKKTYPVFKKLRS